MKTRLASTPSWVRVTPLAACLAVGLSLDCAQPALASPGPQSSTAMPFPTFGLLRNRGGAWDRSIGTHFARDLARPVRHASFDPAAAIVVSNCNDAGAGSLREAAALAMDGDSIDLTQLSCGTITLTTGAIALGGKNLTIQGPGAAALTIDGGGTDRVFTAILHVRDPDFAARAPQGSRSLVEIDGLSITNGLSTSGGCIYSNNAISLVDSNVHDCRAYSATGPAAGGAIYGYQVSLDHSTVSSSTAVSAVGDAGAGGIFAYSVDLLDSTISGNSASTNAASGKYLAVGGGVYAAGGFSSRFSTIADNQATGPVSKYSLGGGIAAGGSVYLYATTVSDNVSAGLFGGLVVVGQSGYGDATILNSTIAGNSATNASGIASFGTPVTLGNSTVAFNTALSNTVGSAAGLFLQDTTADLENSIVANNLAASLPADISGSGTAALTGTNNVVLASSLALPPNTIQIDPALGALADNGGSTLTLLPGGASPAIDAADAAHCRATDQRGIARPQPSGGACDIGAVEFLQTRLAVTVAGAGSVTAQATPPARSGGINACTSAGGSNCEALYGAEGGIAIPLDLSPASNNHIADASGCGGSLIGGTFTTGTLAADCTVSVTFEIDAFNVTATSGGNGAITPPAQTVNFGDIAAFTVTPDTGYHVNAVTGDTCTVTQVAGDQYQSDAIDADCAVTATFAIDTFTVTATSGGNGAVTPPSQSVSFGANAAFTVTPDIGYHVDAVTGDTCTVTQVAGDQYQSDAIDDDCAVTATFALDIFTVTAMSGGNGTITPPTQSVGFGQSAAFTVTPDTGYHVDAVTGDTCTVTQTTGDQYQSDAIDADCAVTATFAIDTFTVTATSGGNGTITPPTQSVDFGNAAAFTVTPDADHHVDSVTGDTCTVTQTTGDQYQSDAIDADCSVTAAFAIDGHNLGGSVGGLAGSGLSLHLDYGTGGVEELPIAADGAFAFIAPIDVGATYTVSIGTQPADPEQSCTIANATGTMPGHDLDNVLVSCTTDGFQVGGSISGLDADGLSLQLNGGTPLAVPAGATSYAFANPLPDESTYTVTIASQPTGQACTVTDASGTIDGADATVDVACTDVAASLTLSVDDDSDYARYGRLVDYVVAIGNTGSAPADVTVASTVLAGFDEGSETWQCFDSGDGASCSTDAGSGALATDASIDPGHTLYIGVTIGVPYQDLEPTATLSVQVAGVNNPEAEDTDTLVLLRGGFDETYPSMPGSVESDPQACAPLDGRTTVTLRMPTQPGERAFDTLWYATTDDGRRVDLERANLDEAPWVRLIVDAPGAVERASPWARADAGAALGLGLGDDRDSKWLLLEGSTPPLQIRFGAAGGVPHAMRATHCH
jgi:hypothetical protein